MTDMNDGDKQAQALLYYATKERWSHAKRGRNVVYIVSASKYWRKVIYAKFWAEIGKYTSGDTI